MDKEIRFIGRCAAMMVLGGSLAMAQQARLEQIVVTGTKTPHALEDAPVETFVIDATRIEQSNAANVSELLKQIPGINTSLSEDVMAADNLRNTMNGLQINEGYALILVDGRRVHGGFGAHGDYGVGLNHVPVGMIERIEVVKGPSSALYGSDAMAGVINIITKKAPTEATGYANARYGVYSLPSVRKGGGSVTEKTSRKRQSVNLGFGDKAFEHSGFFVAVSHEQDEDIREKPQTTTKNSFLGKWHTAFKNGLGLDLV